MRFQPFDRDLWWTRPDTGSFPYSPEWPCNRDAWPAESSWRYDLRYHGGFIRVLGDAPPVAPDLGVRVEIGEGFVAPGAVADVPLRASSEKDLHRLRFALEVAPELAVVESVAFEASFPLSEETRTIEIGRGDGAGTEECGDVDGDGVLDGCFYGTPIRVLYEAVAEERHVLVVFTLAPGQVVSEDLVEIGRLRVRIAEDAPPGAIPIHYTTIPIPRGVFIDDVETGGTPSPPDPKIPFAPAREITAGSVNVSNERFRRGDSNLDGRIDLTDAVFTLDYLFRGGSALGCADAADATDDGSVDISDPILTLRVFFFNGGEIRPPFPDCGVDQSADGLGCGEVCSAP